MRCERVFSDTDFRPKLGSGELPDLQEYAALLPKDFQNAAELWEQTIPDYRDVLYSTVIGDRESLFDPIERGDWRILLRSQRYRNTKTREVIRQRKYLELRDLFTDRMHPHIESLADRLIDRDITLHRWVREMAQLGRSAHLAGYMFGAGGYNTITHSDVVDLEGILRTSFGFLLKLANNVKDGNTTRQDPTTPVVTRRGLVNRGVMWIESITRSFERARTVMYGFHPDILPNYPGDGTTECLSRCRCHWLFRFPQGQDSYYHAYWIARLDGRTCLTCVRYSRIYNPYTVVRF